MLISRLLYIIVNDTNFRIYFQCTYLHKTFQNDTVTSFLKKNSQVLLWESDLQIGTPSLFLETLIVKGTISPVESFSPILAKMGTARKIPQQNARLVNSPINPYDEREKLSFRFNGVRSKVINQGYARRSIGGNNVHWAFYRSREPFERV